LIVIVHPKFTGKAIILLPLGMLLGSIMAESYDRNSLYWLPYLMKVHLVSMTLKVMGRDVHSW
jgi:hypothetical protein